MSWTDERRKAYYEEKKLSYPFEVWTEGVQAPRPEDLSAEFGLFVRVPFPERNTSAWLFTSREQAVMFQHKHRGRMG